jgi:pimeloyl-ACP methyl ester carboxylesterase
MTPTLRSIRLAHGVRLHYAEQGDPGGMPVVLLHGITDSWYSFEPVMAHLPGSLHAFALSQRGHGESDRPGRYRTRDFADDAAAFIEALGLGPALVVGHSMGSANAMRLAIDRPELLRGLMTAGTFAGFSDKADLVEFHRSAIEPLRDPIDPGFAAEWQQSTLARPVPPAFFDRVVRECLRAPAAVWRDAFAALFDDDFAAEIDRIAVPTRVVWGDHDAFCPRADQERIVRAIAGSRLLTYEGAGHALHWEQPARFARDLATFASALTSPAFSEETLQ